MKNLLFIIAFFILIQGGFGQQIFNNFEGINVVTFGVSSGNLDLFAANPAPNNVNSSSTCAKYIRDTALFDYILLYPDTTLRNVSIYTEDGTNTPKITMKLYTSAPVGTTIKLQLGKKSDPVYPSGVYAEFMQITTTQNEWELITFDFDQFPIGGFVLPNQIDKVVLLFNPFCNSRDTMYFDDLFGPQLITEVNIVNANQEDVLLPTKLYQNTPNPAKNNTQINFQLNSPGLVSLELFDILGNSISSLLNKNMKAGIYSIPVETENIPNGIYFYVLKTEENSKSRRMIVSK